MMHSQPRTWKAALAAEAEGAAGGAEGPAGEAEGAAGADLGAAVGGASLEVAGGQAGVGPVKEVAEVAIDLARPAEKLRESSAIAHVAAKAVFACMASRVDLTGYLSSRHGLGI